MNTKFTPGPWRAGMSSVLAWNAETKAWAKISGYHKTASFPPEVGMANITLAAAAPELLEAVRLCTWVMSTWLLPSEDKNSTEAWDSALEKARAAIAKATQP